MQTPMRSQEIHVALAAELERVSDLITRVAPGERSIALAKAIRTVRESGKVEGVLDQVAELLAPE